MATIGVTGHRILHEPEKLRSSIREALERITKRFDSEPITLLTSLAEGTDRMVAKETQSLDSSRIVAVLPMNSIDYLKDFETEESQQEFRSYLGAASEVIEIPESADRESAYEAAGIYVLDHCDALICIWDGLEAQGKGGTGSVVERARRRGIPIAWIHAGNREPGTLKPTSLGTDQGKITYENF
jgi:hypothetical protein